MYACIYFCICLIKSEVVFSPDCPVNSTTNNWLVAFTPTALILISGDKQYPLCLTMHFMECCSGHT